MTRFARAKGSKSSNERTPEDSTPWNVMKDQLLQAKKDSDESKNRQEAEKQRLANYENFLKDRKVQKKKATWCDFPDAEIKTTEKKLTQGGSPAKKKKKNTLKLDDLEKSMHSTENEQNNMINDSEDSIKKTNKKKLQTEGATENKKTQENVSNLIEPVKGNKKNKKNKQKKQFNKSDNAAEFNKTDNTAEFNKTDNPADYNQTDPALVQETNDAPAPNNIPNKASKQQLKGKKKNMTNGQPVRRKEINDNSFQIIINGKAVELVRFDGFPVMKKDAERLQDLKTSMMKKGIPKSEVQRTMKLERRRAEKALARVKRDVCYNCRKGGHVLSDCPELKSKIPSVDAAEGVCFKCGSTEHRQFECKVQRDKEFRFATCFICKEAGHIARQCPDNPRGLYPNGGSCNLCGDVTHMRKDCPTVSDKREGSNIKLQTLDTTENIEDVEHQPKTVTPVNKKPKKVKF